MEELPATIDKMEADLKAVIITLDEVDDENFDNKMERLKFLNEKISNERDELFKNYSEKTLKDYNIQLDKYIKLISERFDNIIRRNKTKQKSVKNALSVTLNNRKLLNYQR